MIVKTNSVKQCLISAKRFSLRVLVLVRVVFFRLSQTYYVGPITHQSVRYFMSLRYIVKQRNTLQSVQYIF